MILSSLGHLLDPLLHSLLSKIHFFTNCISVPLTSLVHPQSTPVSTRTSVTKSLRPVLYVEDSRFFIFGISVLIVGVPLLCPPCILTTVLPEHIKRFLDLYNDFFKCVSLTGINRLNGKFSIRITFKKFLHIILRAFFRSCFTCVEDTIMFIINDYRTWTPTVPSLHCLIFLGLFMSLILDYRI